MAFSAFGLIHWVTLSIIAIVIGVTILFRKPLGATAGRRRWVPIGMTMLAWVFEIAFHIWTYFADYNWIFNLVPLEMCSISMYLSVVLVLTRNQGVFEFYYFISIGAVAALAFPAGGAYGPDHLRFWVYFVCHGFIVWVAVWFLVVERYRLRRSAYWRMLLILIPLAGFIRFVDWKFGVNYMYLAGPSGGATSPLDFLGDGVGYLVKLVLIALTVLGLMYLVGPKQPKPQGAVTQASEPSSEPTTTDNSTVLLTGSTAE